MFIDLLRAGMLETEGCVCVGLDPHVDLIPDSYGTSIEGIGAFLEDVISKTLPHTAAYKPNIAFFEALGPDGLRLLKQVIERIHGLDRGVILDAKRGDIASTAQAYAHAALRVLGADAVTLVAYMGEDAVIPFLEAGGFAFLVAVPSNPSAIPIIEHGDPPLYARIAEMGLSLSARFPGQVGLVVGATQPDKASVVQEQAPGLAWLVPGLGAQGGSAAEFFATLPREQLLVANASRSILFAEDPAKAAETMKHRIEELRHER